MIVEVDGGQHSENASDRVRDQILTAAAIASCGFGIRMF
jgi:very-short-patch-repair endonuclease